MSTHPFDEHNIRNACITAMYMWEGLLAAAERNPEKNIYDLWGCGALELAMALAEYAIYSEARLLQINHENYPGVYDYEVSEPFGAWWAAYIIDNDGNEPDSQLAQDKLNEMIEEFFDGN